MKNFILRYTLGKCCVFVLLLAGLYAWLSALPDASLSAESLRQTVHEKDKILAAGTVASIEEKQDSHHKTQIILSLRSVTFRNKTFQTDKQQFTDGILCYIEEGEKIPLYGQKILVSGRAGCFSDRRNRGEFDAGFYYRTKKLYFYLKDTKIEGHGKDYAPIRQRLYELRKCLKSKILKICGEDAGIMCSLLLGDKEFLLPEIKTLYQSGGISHILAISGLHISFLGAGAYHLLRRIGIPLSMSAGLSGSCLMLYVVMTGASPSALRAGGMFLLCMLADVTGRSYDRRSALALCAVMQILQNPLLFGQSGFWLSYGAVLGLEILLPILQDIGKFWLYRLLTPGLSVFFVTFPILLISYYSFPVYSFFLNLLVIPLMSIVMAGGIFSLFLGFFSETLARFVFYPVHFILYGFEAGCRLCAGLPKNQWIIGKPELWQVLLYICVLLLFCFLGRYMAKAEACLFLLGAVWILTGSLPVKNSITFLDVGQGDGIIVQDTQGRAVMIDCGSSSKNKLAEYTLLPYLKSQGIDTLDYVFVTHTDEDHMSAVRYLLENGDKEIKVKELILPKLSSPDETYMEMLRLARAAGCKIGFMKRGDILEIGSMKYRCLHPRKEWEYPDKNAASLVLHLQMDGMSALFTGDLDGDAQQQFTEDYPEQLGKSDILKAGHHGSKTSCSDEFLEKVHPRYTVVSCGVDNRYGHPAKETLQRLFAKKSRVFITAECGAVRIEYGKKGITVEMENGGMIK